MSTYCVWTPRILALFHLHNVYAMDKYLSTFSNESGANSEEPADTGEHRECRAGTSTSPYHQQSASFMTFLKWIGASEVCQCVLDVLTYMESLQLNLPILLWALSWNKAYLSLVSNNKAHFARTTLTTSNLLPKILRLWHPDRGCVFSFGGLGTWYCLPCSRQGIWEPWQVLPSPTGRALSGDSIGNQMRWFNLQHQDLIPNDLETLLPRHFDTTAR